MKFNTGPSLGRLIRDARRAQGATLRAFAAKMQISASLLSLIEQGEHMPDSELITRLATALGQDADYWCGLAGTLTPCAERSLADLARRDPEFFRIMVERHRGA